MSLDGAKLASGRTGSLRKAGPRGYQDCYAFPRTTTTRTRSLPASFRRPAVGRRYRIALGVSDSSRLTHERTVGCCEAETRASNVKLESGCNVSNFGLLARCRLGACLEIGQLAYSLGTTMCRACARARRRRCSRPARDSTTTITTSQQPRRDSPGPNWKRSPTGAPGRWLCRSDGLVWSPGCACPRRPDPRTCAHDQRAVGFSPAAGRCSFSGAAGWPAIVNGPLSVASRGRGAYKTDGAVSYRRPF